MQISDSLNVKISIKGFENTVYLPITVLYDSIQLSFSDTSIREVVNGAMRYRSYNSGYYQRIGTDDATHTKILFGAGGFSEKNTRRAKPLKKDYLLIYFFCVEVKKEGKIYTIPSRYYFLTD